MGQHGDGLTFSVDLDVQPHVGRHDLRHPRPPIPYAPSVPGGRDEALPEIHVARADVEQFMSRFTVTLRDAAGSSEHVVTLSGADWERLGRGYRSPEDLVRASFGFLLQREPRDAILGSFDVSQIPTFFPEFEREIARPPG